EAEVRLFWDNVDKAIWQLPYVKLWIKAMKKAGYGVYILSNYGSWTYEKTKEVALDFLEKVDGAIFSYEVKQIKPSAAIFQALCEKYSLKPEECVFLDDLPANIEGAKNFGMQGIVFKGLFDALEELKKLDVKIEL
ncbi:MAG: HAD-IA family hydrolase, partial [Lachnospiraceae bacterium]|nr:HAD-IA family hydrolase [Lachnospiraceae bacterium]